LCGARAGGFVVENKDATLRPTMMDLANEADANYDFASNISGRFHFVKKKLSSVPKIEID
jgi:hypothetical protein